METEEPIELPPLEEHTLVEKIDKKDLKPLWDTHEHQYIRDEEETDTYYAQTCIVKGCGIGRLIKKT